MPPAYPDNLFASKTLRGWHVLARPFAARLASRPWLDEPRQSLCQPSRLKKPKPGAMSDSCHLTSNRPLEDWGKLIGDIPSATARHPAISIRSCLHLPNRSHVWRTGKTNARVDLGKGTKTRNYIAFRMVKNGEQCVDSLFGDESGVDGHLPGLVLLSDVSLAEPLGRRVGAQSQMDG
jgi:hypothetical protein